MSAAAAPASPQPRSSAPTPPNASPASAARSWLRSAAASSRRATLILTHAAYRGFPSIGYALSQRQRIQAGWPALAGNHIFVESSTGIIVALCHLQQGSITTQIGARMRTGDPIARCGNSGNSTEPHLHIQAIDTADIKQARAIPITFNNTLPRNGDIVTAP
ncbi:M23 family metallopeptidase [Gulosibacter sediminis]|uniref:M23 family metallopeptidase n=1 Tax=Gulosibacter sediminis TaxID=1729695 RepID=UPI002E2E1145|nr:M23 family metallopeptidase [Gulosibacter sediminis]